MSQEFDFFEERPEVTYLDCFVYQDLDEETQHLTHTGVITLLRGTSSYFTRHSIKRKLAEIHGGTSE